MASLYWKLPKNSVAMVEAVRWALGDQNLLEVEGPPEAVAELVSVPGADALALHLVNYGVQRYPVLKNIWSAHLEGMIPDLDQADRSVKNITVKLKIPAGKKVRQVLLLSPDAGQEQQVLSHEVTDGVIRFVVPRLEIYSLAVIQLEAE